MKGKSAFRARRNWAGWILALSFLAVPVLAGAALAQDPLEDDQEYMVITPHGIKCYAECGRYQICC